MTGIRSPSWRVKRRCLAELPAQAAEPRSGGPGQGRSSGAGPVLAGRAALHPAGRWLPGVLPGGDSPGASARCPGRYFSQGSVREGSFLAPFLPASGDVLEESFQDILGDLVKGGAVTQINRMDPDLPGAHPHGFGCRYGPSLGCPDLMAPRFGCRIPPLHIEMDG